MLGTVRIKDKYSIKIYLNSSGYYNKNMFTSESIEHINTIVNILDKNLLNSFFLYNDC